ncbi:phosphotransferase family protein [Sphaerisporangium viridialbum]|uniref:phosphotransferase family protein n=1 Tax=Sphaerisporangium viridialbum TaxID=46189 RepID=UPI003C74158F
MEQPPGRLVSALVTAGGRLIGTVGPFPVRGPRWADVEPVVAHLRRALGVPVVVLRLVTVDGGGGARDGHVTYHVEALQPPGPLSQADGGLPPGPGAGAFPQWEPGASYQARPGYAELTAPVAGRAAWATAAGVREALGWAAAALRDAGRQPVGPVEQVKTWNLAGLFRVPTSAGPAWLKTTPPFATCEATAIEVVGQADPGLVPVVLAADPARGWVLLEHIPGADCWNASEEVIREAVSRMATAQAAIARRGTVPHGLPDRRPRALARQVNDLLDGEAAGSLTTGELSEAWRLAERLPALITALEECGLPDTLVHGDFHPGNWRSGGRGTVVLDFADGHYGHPAVDGLRPRDFLPEARWASAADAWAGAWSALVPGSDPVRALALAEPLSHLSYAVRYQEFLDNIEDSERRYHEGDPAAEIRAALAAMAATPL